MGQSAIPTMSALRLSGTAWYLTCVYAAGDLVPDRCIGGPNLVLIETGTPTDFSPMLLCQFDMLQHKLVLSQTTVSNMVTSAVSNTLTLRALAVSFTSSY